VVLGLLGSLLAYISLFGFHKIPFTCSYLPGKSQIHMIWLAVLGFQLLIGECVRIERRALDHPGSYAIMVAVFVIAVLCARWQAVSGSASDGAMVQFEDLPAPAVMSLGLHRDGTFPIPSLRHDSAS
jgi:hypothetical protein